MIRSQKNARAGWTALLVACCSLGPTHASANLVDGTWSALDSSVIAPSSRREQVAIFDETHNCYLMFGGFGFGSTAPQYNFNEVWALSMSDPPTWTQLSVAGTPPGPRKQSQWGYDIARRRLLIFGGYGQHSASDSMVTWQNDVWQLSLDDTPTWTELFPSGTPPSGRLAGISVYDPLRQRFVGFGGTAGAPVDTWSLDLSGDPAWGTIDTGGQNPAGAYGMGCIYDPLRDRMVVFGGSLGAEYYGSQNNIWELTLDDAPAWHRLYPADTSASSQPKPRRSMTAVYDPMRDRMVIYGGFDALQNSDAFLPDTWALSLSGDPAWQQLAPDGPIPPGRDASAAIYDPNGDRLVVYGGWSGTHMLGDTEYLTWGQNPEAAAVTATASATMTSASLNWSLTQATGVHTAVFRKDASQPWTSIATVDASPTGAVAFVDHNVAAGAQYSYELAVSSQRGPMVGGQVAVSIPTALGVTWRPGLDFALSPVSPNPVARSFDVTFALPNSSPARLEVMDVTGRLVAAREVGALGAGNHHLTLGSAREFAPGIYFVRLSRAEQTLTTRAVVLGGS